MLQKTRLVGPDVIGFSIGSFMEHIVDERAHDDLC